MMAQWQNAAQTLIAASLNSIPEGILLVSLVWLILRLLPRQNSRTRFALWFVVLLAIAALPFTRTFAAPHALTAAAANRRHAFLNLPDKWALILFALWLAAATFAMLRLIVGLFGLGSLLRRCVPINRAQLAPATRKVIEDFCSSRSVSVALSEKLSVPAAVGFLRPMIVLPEWAARELSPEQLEIVLLHEYAHIERRDGWTNLLQKTLRAVFCFHPAVWWLESRLSLEREMACDDYVLAQTNDPHAYGKCLIALLERTLPARALAMAQAVVHRAHEATKRLTQILDNDRARTKRLWKPAMGMVSALSLLTLIVLPQTRQLVGFAPTHQAASRDAAIRPLALTSPSVTAAVVPAALHSSAVAGEKKFEGKRSHHRLTLPKSGNNDEVLAAAIDAQRLSADVLPVTAKAAIGPAREAVLVIRTANQIGPDSWEWTVAVWRVSVVPEHSKRAPVAASKT